MPTKKNDGDNGGVASTSHQGAQASGSTDKMEELTSMVQMLIDSQVDRDKEGDT